MTKTITKEQFDNIQSILAIFANCEAINESGEPDTLTLEEIQTLGAQALDWLDGISPQTEEAAEAA